MDSIAQAIQTREGYYPGSLAYRNNNPGNLVYAGQPGATPGAGGFAAFSSYSAGYSALENQINLDFTRGTDVNGKPINTVADLINSWAPPSENDTAGYIAAVSAQTGLDPDASLSLDTSGDGGTAASFSFDAGPGIDLSSLGLPSSVSPWWLGAGALGLVLFFGR